MIEGNFNVQGDLLCTSDEVTSKLVSATVTCDCGSTRTYKDGTTCLVVDLGEVYILYRDKWYKL